MVLDLRTPWSWVKSPSCKQVTRNGTSFGPDCSFKSKTNSSETFSQTYDCQKGCKQIEDKCAEIDLTQEGLSLT